MPKQVILCDHENCSGHLTLFAQSKPDTGMQYDDPTHRAHFYQCSGDPKHIYIANAGRDAEHVNVNSMKPYTGNMTADYIKMVIHLHSGNFYQGDDDVADCRELLEKLPPEKGHTKLVRVGSERRNDRWGTSEAVIRLPDSWIGKEVMVIVQ